MRSKRHKPEEIVTKLRQVEVLLGQGMAQQPSVNILNRPRRFQAPESLIQSQIPTVRFESLADVLTLFSDDRFASVSRHAWPCD
jgi:hypothetical protein